jgi:hypothetical protein
VDLKGKPYEYILPTYPVVGACSLWNCCQLHKPEIQDPRECHQQWLQSEVKLVVLTELKEASERVAEVVA